MSNDRFDQVVSELIQPMSALPDGPYDALYLLRKDGGLVYTEGYWHPGGKVIGKLIYYPDPHGRKNIHGRSYTSIVKDVRDGEEVYVSHEDQLCRVFRLLPDLPPDANRLILAEYQIAFPLEDFAGFFDPRRGLAYLMANHPDVDAVVRKTAEILEVSVADLGITGSSALGKKGGDIDLVFFNSPEKNMETVRRLWGIVYSQPDKQVVEYGKFWPLKMYVDGEEICTFWGYRSSASAPVRDCRVELLKDEVEVYGTVSDNLHSLYVPLVLGLENVYIDGEKTGPIRTVIYDGAVRGEFRKGLRLRIMGKLVNLIKDSGETETVVSVTDGFNITLERFKAGVPHLERPVRE
ncbi:MAG TPA: hypothetical protein PK636_01950 [bacterium]|nr:hypothetical protein [bacterium]HPJ71429.1 hypothetical protein [bacterium]HPQ65368.1 hypothetical protein [bacterium]